MSPILFHKWNSAREKEQNLFYERLFVMSVPEAVLPLTYLTCFAFLGFNFRQRQKEAIFFAKKNRKGKKHEEGAVKNVKGDTPENGISF